MAVGGGAAEDVTDADGAATEALAEGAEGAAGSGAEEPAQDARARQSKRRIRSVF